MDNERTEQLESLVDAACGPSGHATQPGEEGRFQEYRRLDRALKTPVFEPPAPLVALAKSLLPERVRRIVLARLVFSTLQPLAVRSTRPNSFQLSFQADEVKVRLMVAPERGSWEVVGQVSEPGWSVSQGGKQFATDEHGRFTFCARSLGQTNLALLKDEVELRVPPAEEAAESGPGSPH
jgi:hypothetical protein